MILLHSFSIHLFFLWVKFLSCITIVSQPINNNFKRCWSFFITFWNLSRPKVILDVESNVTSLHSKKRWVVFSTQMLGWDRWVRALGCFNPILGWKLVLIITQRRWVGNADVKESTHVTSTFRRHPDDTSGRSRHFLSLNEASERRYGK